MTNIVGKAYFRVSPCLVVTISVLLYAFTRKYIISVLLAVLVHELTHVALMRLLGLNIKRGSIEQGGLCIDFSSGTAYADAIAALAEPAAGILLYYLCDTFLSGGWSEMTGRVSMYLSLFNLLPSLPLDGGMALASLLRAFVNTNSCNRIISFIGAGVSLFMLLAGLIFLCIGPGLAAAGIWLIYCNINLLYL